MQRRQHLWTLVGLAALAGCSDPSKIDVTPVPPNALEDCAASAEWLPNTPPLSLFSPAPHPTTECPFYRGVWQTFLQALQPDASGKPALLSYPTIDTVFTRVNNPHGASWSYLGDIKQAGERRILIDQNGNTLYYGIHMNQAFADFIRANGLQTAKAIQDYHDTKPTLFFPGGLAEFKSAWQVVEATDPTASDPTYLTIDTTVPTIVQDPVTHAITEDRTRPRPVKVRLLAIHVVYTYPGHPEFIWGSMEHTNADLSAGESDTKATDGHRDVAPIIPEDRNPTSDDPNNSLDTMVVDPHSMVLYKGGTDAAHGNVPKQESELTLDAAKQKFLNAADGSSQETSIYRMFPASKSNETAPDDAITSLNHNVEALFAQANLPDTDKRSHYRLVGAQWMDKPSFFHLDFPIQNDATNPYAQSKDTPVDVPVGSTSDVPTKAIGLDAFRAAIAADGSDSPYSILAGEDRMSSTAMESFTQAPGAFNNCFTCHNTQSITANGVPLNGNRSGIILLEPGLLNVSHILSQFVLEECAEGPNAQLVTNADGSKTAVCP
jgi:hypothetical protein